MWDEVGRPLELASWVADPGEVPLTAEELDTARGLVDPGLVYQLVDVRSSRSKKRCAVAISLSFTSIAAAICSGRDGSAFPDGIAASPV